MKCKIKTLLVLIIHAILLTIAFPATAQSITQLTITGDDSLPGNVGDYPITSTFSWMSHLFPSNTTPFSWTLGPGSDGGVVFDRPQNPGAMMGIRLMFNQPTTFYSVGSGLSIDNSNVIDMANLRMKQSSTIIDVGSGSGFDTLGPRVSDISLLLPGANGWSLNQDGTYFLIYNTRGTCDTCNLTLHLYGTALVPIPPALLLFLSGSFLFGNFGMKRKVG